MPGLIRGVARTAAIAGTATAVSNRVSRRQASRWAAEAPAPQYEAAPPPPPAAPAPPANDPIALLSDLGRLHEAGTLTDEEFAAQKARILAQM
ncbi:SHOCT domain-containing protein [Aeromicrobium choanae]|uniref:Short C-terminal domain-containing protein n=1 Tax=Aeromicrobium choanae TaxID=1736691 RepID=A0A1T4Z839_9ACTN|nr:SHOCT domain-containing protein [Aeromicrobium choanae]SKB10237.1 Short C-terminal domain-containing protein [Aeromicrobium choanae]